MTNGPERTQGVLAKRFIAAEEAILAQLSKQVPSSALSETTEIGSSQLPAIRIVQSVDGTSSVALRSDRSWLVTVNGQAEAFENVRVKNILLAYAMITDPDFTTRLSHHLLMDSQNPRIRQWGQHFAADQYIREHELELFGGLVEKMEERTKDIVR